MNFFAQVKPRFLLHRGRVRRKLTVIPAIWEKGYPVEGHDPAEYRKDKYGAMIRLDDYGNRYSPFGWEIDQIVPSAQGGGDDLLNLRPLQWENQQRVHAECTSVS